MLFAFDTPDAAKEWVAVNDGVMGGVSDGRFKLTNDPEQDADYEYWKAEDRYWKSG